MKITKPKRDKRTNLQKEIDSVVLMMSKTYPQTEEYSAMAKNLETLMNAQSKQRVNEITRDTIVIVAGNLLGIALILGYEQMHVVTSKALGFVLRGRV